MALIIHKSAPLSQAASPLKKPPITVRDLEAKIFDLEDIVVRIRASQDTPVTDYVTMADEVYVRKASGTTSITDWLDQRVRPCLNGLEVSVISGDYTTPHGRTKLSTLRDSYEK